MNAQGEDVVSGVRTPLSISELDRAMPLVYDQLRTITGKMEKHYRDMQDFEFTIHPQSSPGHPGAGESK